SKEIPMSFRALFDFWKRHPGKQGRRTLRRPSALRFHLDILEDRTLLTFFAPVSYAAGTNPAAVVTADFNSDGRLDLAVANAGSNTISILLGNGDGSFRGAQHSAAAAGTCSSAAPAPTPSGPAAAAPS